MPREIIIDVAPNGDTRFLYSDTMLPLVNDQAQISRASHVEPGDPGKGQNPLKWYANMVPVNGPLLGPFDNHSEAIAQEVAWINQHVLMPA